MSRAFLPLRRRALVGDPGASRASIPSRRELVVVIRRVQGIPSTTAAGAGGNVTTARLGRPLPSRLAGAGG